MSRTNPIIKLSCGLIKTYQKFISPMLGPRCRFYPSCSEYAKEALIHHGFARGGYLATRRCLKCHPFHPGGIDFVPGTEANKADAAVENTQRVSKSIGAKNQEIQMAEISPQHKLGETS